jgi:signal peptidase I
VRRLRGALAAALVSLVALAVGVGAVVAFTDRSAFVVVSGSMSPALHTGDLVIVEPAGPEAYRPGDVITYREAARGRITHRVIARTPSGDYVTRGDANRVADTDPVPPTAVEGRVRWVVPQAGRPLLWADQGAAGLVRLAILAGVLLGAVSVLAAPPGRDLRPVCLGATPAA